MILAAGRGERLRPLTDATPKPLLLVRGEPLIERHVIGLARAGMKRHRDQSRLAGFADQRLSAAMAHATACPSRTARNGRVHSRPRGGIFRALPHLDPGPFAVVNGDIYTDFPFASLDDGRRSRCPPGAGAEPAAAPARGFRIGAGPGAAGGRGSVHVFRHRACIDAGFLPAAATAYSP